MPLLLDRVPLWASTRSARSRRDGVAAADPAAVPFLVERAKNLAATPPLDRVRLGVDQ